MTEKGSGLWFRAILPSRFIECQRGVAAVEFALILPVLILLLLGASELTRALTYNRKVTQAGYTVGDLVAQSDSVSASDVTDIYAAAGAIMQPYPSDGLNVVIASVVFDEDANATVAWSCTNGSGAWPTGGSPPITIPDGLKLANTSLIITVSSYSYRPTFDAIIPNGIEMGETFFLRPRLVETISDPGC
ncbi:TadE/TadG family type IV pilus assembly protein [Breoghania sp.]|uniref:TadE/TadG family type IV pilus assembly protein n=1 Tax=Breoghania sp. TaxID=2065378 RepID=UPI002AAB326D|nr:TadE/TadG family type IV pilus assembly protein [Breoghania sp.]